jgi:hypothetical protein
VIGASDNETGNQKYGGDWILENTREDILGVYFTGSIVTDFKGTLAPTPITASRTIDAAYLTTTDNWPITIQGGTSGTPVVITIIEDATIPASVANDGYFIINSAYITIDGGGHTLTVAYTGGYGGLVQNGTSGGNGWSNVTIKNIKVATASSSVILATNGGWIGRSYYGRVGTSNTIDNCSSSGLISGSNSGGIVGSSAGYASSQFTVTNCSSSGTISGLYSGGIVGYQAGQLGQVTVTNCSSSGIISGSFSGGISGRRFGYNTNRLCKIENCYSTGIMTGGFSGGICGGLVGFNDNSAYTPQIQITNCFSWGSFDSTSGGICGGSTSVYTNTPSVTISNCYILQSGSMVSPFLTIPITLVNTYIASGNWSDSSAFSSLIGLSFVWSSTSPNTPYVLISDPTPSSSFPVNKIISSSTSLSTTDLQTLSNWPIMINGGTSTENPVVVTITGDATLTDIQCFFIMNGNYVTIKGGDKTMKITATGYPGLVRTVGYSDTTISNIKVDGTGATQLDTSGWIGQEGFGSGTSNNKIENCSSSGTINVSCGGIVGIEAGYNSGQVTVTNCSSSGTISGTQSGGIVGVEAGYNSGQVTVTNCSSSGIISGSNSGGIIGSYAGYTSGQVTVTNCSSSGIISGSYSGGIIGSYTGSNSGQVTVTNCSSSGTISATASGGIVGGRAGYTSGQVTVTNCSSSGIISGLASGGIVGANAGQISGQVTVTNCSSSGTISGEDSGGISGDFFGYNTSELCTIENCYSSGTISGITAGGICGAEIGYNISTTPSYIPQVQIINCYVWGSISSDCGGICGGGDTSLYTNTPSVTISNCYLLQSGDLIASSLQIKASIITSNTYLANGAWNDTSASASGALTGVPVSFPGAGSTWSSTGANTPFLLSSYTSTYTPSSQTILAGGTSSIAPYSGGVYRLFSVNGSTSFSYFTINASTGAITNSSTTPFGDYTMVVYYDYGDIYSFLSMNLVVIIVPTITTSLIVNGNQIYLSGTAYPPILSILNSSNNVVVGTTNVSTDGSWSFLTDVLPSGTYSYKARETINGVDYTSDASPPLTIQILPTITSSLIINGNQIYLSGTGYSTLLSILNSSDNVVVGTTTVNAEGTWSFLTDRLPNGTYSYKARETINGVDYTSDASPPLTIQIDTNTNIFLENTSIPTPRSTVNNLTIQTISTDAQNAISQKRIIHSVDFNGAIPGFEETIGTWEEAQRLWNDVLFNTVNSIEAYGRAYTTGDTTEIKQAANDLVEELQTNVNQLAVRYKENAFRLYLQDNEYEFVTENITIGATSNTINAPLGISPQKIAMVMQALTTINKNGGIYLGENYSSTIKPGGMTIEIAGGVYSLNTNEDPMFSLRLSISKLS